MSSRYYGGSHSLDNYLSGDIYPSNFSYLDPNLDPDLLKLWRINEFVQLIVDWMPYEAFRQWIQFVEDEGPINGLKFGKPYIFKGYEYKDKITGETHSMTGFEEYCRWNKIQQEFTLAVSMSRLYPEGSLLVFLDDIPISYSDSNNEIYWKKNPNPQGYHAMKSWQPIQVGTGTGFEVYESDEFGNVLKWKLNLFTKHMKKAKTFIVDADRCLHIQWIKKENKWESSSRVAGFAKIVQLETEVFQKLSKRAHDIAGGILTFKGISSKEEQEAIDDAIGGDLTSVDRIYLQEGREIEYVTPDLKAAGEFSSIFEMFTKKLCRHMRVSQLILDGEHTGAGLGANNNIEMLNSYSEIYQIQEHYRSDLEKVFFKLGKNNTTFIYNEILPEEMTSMNEEIGNDESKNETNITEESKSEKDEKTEGKEQNDS